MSPCSPGDFRVSRSMENFSRPTRLSVTTVDVSPPSEILTSKLSAMSPLNHTTTTTLAKPLPHLPSEIVVHAVSTRDEIALPLRTAPLPSPPKPVMEVVEEEATEENDLWRDVPSASPILVLPPPTSLTDRQQKRRSQSSGDLNFNTVSYDMATRFSSRAINTPQVTCDASPRSKKRISVGVKPINIEEWEDAIDYSWEHPADFEELEATGITAVCRRRPSALSNPLETYLTVEQNSPVDGHSSQSTPLMMQMSSNTSHDEKPPSSGVQDEEPSSPLLGLNIENIREIHAGSLAEAATPAEDVQEINFSGDVYRSNSRRSPMSIMSESSSQESIIASIFGTHRSSNSSTSLFDFAHLTNRQLCQLCGHPHVGFPRFFYFPCREAYPGKQPRHST